MEVDFGAAWGGERKDSVRREVLRIEQMPKEKKIIWGDTKEEEETYRNRYKI
jgi:hypothetical protein